MTAAEHRLRRGVLALDQSNATRGEGGVEYFGGQIRHRVGLHSRAFAISEEAAAGVGLNGFNRVAIVSGSPAQAHRSRCGAEGGVRSTGRVWSSRWCQRVAGR